MPFAFFLVSNSIILQRPDPEPVLYFSTTGGLWHIINIDKNNGMEWLELTTKANHSNRDATIHLRVSRQNNYCCMQCWKQYQHLTIQSFTTFQIPPKVPQCLQHKLEWSRSRKGQGVLCCCMEHPNETCWAWHMRSQLAPNPHDTSRDRQCCWNKTRDGERRGPRKQHLMKLQRCEMNLYFRISWNRIEKKYFIQPRHLKLTKGLFHDTNLY